MGRTSCWAVLGCALLGAASALEVTMPEEGDTLVAGRTYTVEWEGTGDSRFEIDLYYCDSSCTGDDCGEWVTSLCPFGEMGCPDTAGDYDVVMPEPSLGQESGYKIRVVDINDEDSNDCSGAFTLIASDDTPTMEMDGPYLEVTSPMEGDMALACMEYTLEWEYDDGLGNSAGRFALDLYEADGSGDCGTFVTSICDKEAIGCKDTQGDYDVTIPCDISSGEYRIRVGVFEDDGVFGCSDTFSIFGDDDTTTGGDFSMSYMFRFI